MLHLIFGGLISDPGIFLWFCLKPQGFLRVLNFAPMRSSPSRGSQWGGGFYGYRLKFGLFYGYRLIFFSYG